MARQNFKLTVSYNGADFYGWQRQEKFVTAQGMVEYCLEKFFGRKTLVKGASRTDAGVHAYGQVCSFMSDTPVPPEGLKKILNGLLPDGIRIVKASAEHESFCARYNVREKFYRYVICDSPFEYAFEKNFYWHTGGKIDINKMRELLPLFKGVKNYFSFSRANPDNRKYDRQINSIKITRKGRFIYLDFRGKSFLYNMIRKITAVFVMYSRGELAYADVERMFAEENRAIGRMLAPAGGLYLVKITYNKIPAQTAAEDEEGGSDESE